MNGRSKDEEGSPQLLDLIPKDREWHVNRDDQSSEERKLELRLGPPGEEDYAVREIDDSRLSLGYYSNSPTINGGRNQNILSFPWACIGKKTQNNQHMGASSSSSLQSQPSSANTAVPNSSQKRTASGSVVGWPPIRSFRKNLASSSSSKPVGWPPIRSYRKNLASSSSSKPPHESQNQHVVTTDKVAGKKLVADNVVGKGVFVKINMDGVPIGRKVDLSAYDSYEKLSSAVDELFRDLLAAQRDSCTGGTQSKQEEEKVITGVLDGSGEYTLVYEDNEGDRMLVGDVPWHMFISTVKRLRVLKSSALSAFTLCSKQGKETT